MWKRQSNQPLQQPLHFFATLAVIQWCFLHFLTKIEYNYCVTYMTQHLSFPQSRRSAAFADAYPSAALRKSNLGRNLSWPNKACKFWSNVLHVPLGCIWHFICTRLLVSALSWGTCEWKEEILWVEKKPNQPDPLKQADFKKLSVRGCFQQGDPLTLENTHHLENLVTLTTVRFEEWFLPCEFTIKYQHLLSLSKRQSGLITVECVE